MKRIANRVATRATIALAAALVAAPLALDAQTANGTVNASATVQAYLQVSNVSDLNLGQITPGNGATVAPGSAAGAGQSLGVLRIDHNSNVSVVASVPAGLSLAGAPDLPVSFSCGFATNPTGALAGGASECGSLPVREGSGNGSTQTTYLQMGGEILGTDTSDRAPGTYTGSVVFTITAAY